MQQQIISYDCVVCLAGKCCLFSPALQHVAVDLVAEHGLALERGPMRSLQRHLHLRQLPVGGALVKLALVVDALRVKSDIVEKPAELPQCALACPMWTVLLAPH